jgi:hypothetical protein
MTSSWGYVSTGGLAITTWPRAQLWLFFLHNISQGLWIVDCGKAAAFLPLPSPGTSRRSSAIPARPSGAAPEGPATARFDTTVELKKRPTCRLWALEQLRPQIHHPDQPAAHIAFQTHWARFVSNMGHRSPHLRVLGAHFHHF